MCCVFEHGLVKGMTNGAFSNVDGPPLPAPFSFVANDPRRVRVEAAVLVLGERKSRRAPLLFRGQHYSLGGVGLCGHEGTGRGDAAESYDGGEGCYRDGCEV